MRILVIGRDGMLARAMRRVLVLHGHAVRAVGRQEHDILAPGEPLDLRDIDAVVNCAGLTNRRLSGADAAPRAFLANSLFPRVLADRCEALAIPMIHISTDCAFSGKHGNRVESDEADAEDLYGRSKVLGEPRNAMVLRTSIIGPEVVNGDGLLCWFLAQTGECLGFDHHLWNGVTTLELSRIVAVVLGRNLHVPGIRHVFGEAQTKRAMLEAFARHFDHRIRILPAPPGPGRDMRLATLHPAFLGQLAVRSFADQLDEIAPLMDRRGYWRPGISP